MERSCAATVHGERLQSWGCQRKGVIERNHKWYCRQHDPDAVKARDDARRQRWDDEQRTRDRTYAAASALKNRLGLGFVMLVDNERARLSLTMEEVIQLLDKLGR